MGPWRGSSPAAHRPPAPPARCPNPGPATGADPHPGHTRAPCGRSGHTGAKHRFAAAPAPPPACRRRRLPPRTPRTRCPRSPCAYRHPAAHAITSHCARRCPLLWFLTLDKPETLSDNDVRPLISTTHPRKGQKSQKSQEFRAVRNVRHTPPYRIQPRVSFGLRSWHQDASIGGRRRAAPGRRAAQGARGRRFRRRCRAHRHRRHLDGAGKPVRRDHSRCHAARRQWLSGVPDPARRRQLDTNSDVDREGRCLGRG